MQKGGARWTMTIGWNHDVIFRQTDIMPSGQRRGRRSNQPTCMRWYVPQVHSLLGTIKSATLCVGRDIATGQQKLKLGHWMPVASH